MVDALITKVSYRPKLFISTVLLLSLIACSPAQKHLNSNQSSNFLATDVESCQKKASALIDRETRLDQSYNRADGNSLELSFVEFDARKQRGRYFDNCMSQRGYEKTQDKKK